MASSTENIWDDEELVSAVNEFEQTNVKKIQGRRPDHEKWELMRTEFEQFYIKNGRLPKSKGKLLEEGKLFNWRQHQLTSMSHNTLYQSRIDALNATKGWNWGTNKRKHEEEADDTEEAEELIIKPASKRRRLEMPWLAQEDQIKFVQKISELEEQLKEKDSVIQKQFAIMERQYKLIEELKTASK